MPFSNIDGTQEFIRGPVRLPNCGHTCERNVIHTVLDGFAIDWEVVNFQTGFLVTVDKYPTSRERIRERDEARGRFRIPPGIWGTLHNMAQNELKNEKEREKKPRAKTPSGQLKLFQ